MSCQWDLRQERRNTCSDGSLLDLLQVLRYSLRKTKGSTHNADAPLATQVLSLLCSPARNYIRASLSFLIFSQIAHMSKSCCKSVPHIHLWVRPSDFVMRNNLIIIGGVAICKYVVIFIKRGTRYQNTQPIQSIYDT